MANGFSLIEILVVMVLFGLMVSLHPTIGSALFSSLTAESAARQVMSDLNKVRSQALFENRETLFVIDTADHWYRAVGEDVDLAGPSGLALSLTTASAERYSNDVGGIRFFPDGSSSGGRITLDNDGEVYDIIVDWFDGRTHIAQPTNDSN
jgi:general secretion pathway protein H